MANPLTASRIINVDEFFFPSVAVAVSLGLDTFLHTQRGSIESQLIQSAAGESSW